MSRPRGPVLPLLALFLLLVSFATVAADAPVSTTTPNSHGPVISATTSSSMIVIEGPRGIKGSVSTMGGAIRLFRDITKPGQNGTMKTAEIVVSFEQLRELNSNFTQVVDNNNRTHMLKSFVDQNFTCINDTNFPILYSNNVTADCLFCWTSLKDLLAPVNFRLNACVIKQNGTITQQNEVTKVTVGQVKFSVEITKGWPWCDSTCRGGAGTYLDLDIALKLPAGVDKMVKSQPVQETNRPKKFDLGAGAMVEFSTVVAVDGAWKSLVYPTPSLLQRDGVNTVTLRFPHFDTNLVYDPTIETGDKAWMGSSAWSTTASPLSLLAACCLLALLRA